jgi:hypothetical protein
MSENSEDMTSGALQSSRSGFFTSNLTSVPRSMRYNPIGGVPSVLHSGRWRKGRPTKRKNSTNYHNSSSAVHMRAASRVLRRQEIHRPHVGVERRRRDKLKASYHRLKNVVPTHGFSLVSHPPPTKIALLDRAATRIDSLEKSRQQLLAKIREVEEGAARLREANEALALSVLGHHPVVAPSSS